MRRQAASLRVSSLWVTLWHCFLVFTSTHICSAFLHTYIWPIFLARSCRALASFSQPNRTSSRSCTSSLYLQHLHVTNSACIAAAAYSIYLFENRRLFTVLELSKVAQTLQSLHALKYDREYLIPRFNRQEIIQAVQGEVNPAQSRRNLWEER